MPAFFRFYGNGDAGARARELISNDFLITRDLEIEGILKPLEIVDSESPSFLVLPAFDGIALKERLSLGLASPAAAIALARRLLNILGRIHTEGILHLAVNPYNILVPKGGGTRGLSAAVLTGFGHAIRNGASDEPPSVKDFPQEFLPYVSPEQTGRTEANPDHRSDYYSLGTILYEMLTGLPPFPFLDARGVAYAHLTRVPHPPHEIRTGVPLGLSGFILRLLSKDPAERFPSAFEALRALSPRRAETRKNTGHGGRRAAMEDRGDRIPPSREESLPGREMERKTILELLRKSAGGGSALLCVSGYPGVGKTTLVRRALETACGSSGFFLYGKFEQRASAPYDALVQAVESLVDKLQAGASRDFERLRGRIAGSLTGNLRYLRPVFPTLGRLCAAEDPAVLEEQPPSLERKHLLHQGVVSFLRSITETGSTLVLFLDDIQWADRTSLELCMNIVDASVPGLFLAIAYRVNAIPPGHALFPLVDELERKAGAEGRIGLGPLSGGDVRILLDRRFPGLSSGHSKALERFVSVRTGGNPLFILEQTRRLRQERSLHFDFLKGRWIYEPSSGEETDGSREVTEFLASTMEGLPPEQLETLKVASCFARGMRSPVLAAVMGATVEHTASTVKRLIHRGFLEAEPISPSEAGIDARFAHDTIRQAAHSLIPEQERALLHLRIGRLLREVKERPATDTELYDLVEHFSLARGHVTEKEERYRCAALDLEAGIRAKKGGAFPSAYGYLSAGLAFLPQDSWKERYPLALSLHEEAAEAAFLAGEQRRMDELIGEVLRKSRTVLDSVKAREIRIQAFVAAHRPMDATEACFEALSLLGFRSAAPGKPIRAFLSRFAARLLLLRLDLERPRIKPLRDPVVSAVMSLLSRGFGAAYLAIPGAFTTMVTEMVRLTLTRGYSVHSPFAFVSYGLSECRRGKRERGYRYGRFALELMKRFDLRFLKAKLNMVFYFFISPWKDPINESLAPLMEAFTAGSESGDFEYAGLAATTYCHHLIFSGKELGGSEQEMAGLEEKIWRMKQERAALGIRRHRQFALNLMGKRTSGDPWEFTGPAFDEAVLMPRLEAANDLSGIATIFLYKAILAFLFGRRAIAIEFIGKAAGMPHVISSQTLESLVDFYHPLILLASYSSAGHARRMALLKSVRQYRRKLKKMAAGAPKNFKYRLDLVSAELLSLKGKRDAAERGYEEAAAGAAASGLIQDQALARELFAAHWGRLGESERQRECLREARDLYRRWGAAAKVEELERVHSWLRDVHSPGAISTDPAATPMDLDLETVMDAGRVISSEMETESLVLKVIRIIMRCAGADRGILSIEENGAPTAVAEGRAVGDSIETHVRMDDPILHEPLAMYVRRTGESVVTGHGSEDDRRKGNPNERLGSDARSVLCMPVRHQGALKGLVYLENSLMPGVFTPERLKVVELLAAQAAVSFENASLYRLRETLAEQRERLLRADRLASVGVLAAGVAHEVGNPNHIIRLNVEFLTEAFGNALALFEDSGLSGKDAGSARMRELHDRFERAAADIRESSLRIQQISGDLKNFVRAGASGCAEIVDLNKVVDSTLRLSADFIRKATSHLTIELDPDLKPVKGSFGRLQQLVLNLIENACQALTDQGQSIGIRTLVRRRTGKVILRVTDEGRGVRAEDLPRLAEPFFTTRREDGGTGLGLSISAAIVKEHGGTIHFASQSGKGMAVTVTLPSAGKPLP